MLMYYLLKLIMCTAHQSVLTHLLSNTANQRSDHLGLSFEALWTGAVYLSCSVSRQASVSSFI
jgi:hypothetical protein